MTIHSSSLIYRNGVSKQRRQVITGQTKTLYDGAEAGTYVLQFKDQIVTSENTALEVQGKGALNNRLSELFLSRLNEMGIETHFIKRLNMSEQLVKSAEIIPLRLTVHNIAVDRLAERLGLEDPYLLVQPIFEFSFKSRKLGYPIVSEDHIEVLEWATADEIEDMKHLAQRVNDFLNGHFYAVGLRLLNFSLEFGRVYDFYDDAQLLIVDEISPDTCSILDLKTGERLDGVVCQEDQEEGRSLSEKYQEVARRFGLLEEGGPLDLRDPVVYVGEVQVTDGVVKEEELVLEPVSQSSVLSFSQKNPSEFAE